ncbi:MAG: tetratricopeptide repeat protein [Spirochaetes bacterium]|nr:tetratricopeptide repeat protein [Spirochaetota bacterium]
MNKKISIYILFLQVMIFSSVFPAIAYAKAVKNADYYCERGIFYYGKGEYDKAAVEWERALKLDPDHKLANRYLVESTRKNSKLNYCMKQAIKSFQEKDYIEALENINTVYELDIDELLATIYVTKIKMEIKKDKKLREEVIENFKSDAVQYDNKSDGASIKKAAGIYTTLAILDPEEKEFKRKQDFYKKKLPLVIKEEKIRAYVEAGEAYYEEEKYDKALNLWKNTAKEVPAEISLKKKIDSASRLYTVRQEEVKIKSLIEKGESDLKGGSLDSAAVVFNEVLKLDPENEEAQKYKSQLLFQQRKKIIIEKIEGLLKTGITSYKSSQYERSISTMADCLKLSPGNRFAKRYLELSTVKLLEKQEETPDIRSEYYNIIFNLVKRGEYYYRNRNYRQSMELWGAVLNLFPLNKEARMYMAKCSIHLDKRSVDSLVSGYLDSGKTHLKKGQKASALRDFTMVKNLNADHPDIYGLIRSASSKKERKNADQIIRKHYNKGLFYYKKKEYRKAKSSWEKILAFDPDHMDTILKINRVDHILNYNEDNIRKKRVVKEKTKIQEYYNKGIKYYTEGELDKAMDMWEAVLKLDPDNVKARNNIRICRQVMKSDD